MIPSRRDRSMTTMSFCKSNSSFNSPIWLESCKKPKCTVQPNPEQPLTNVWTATLWFIYLSFFILLKHHKLFSEDTWRFLKDKTVRDTTSECVLLQKGSLVCIFEQRICTFSTTSSTHHAKGSRTDTGNTGKYERREMMRLLGLPFHFICESVCNIGTRKTNIWGCCSEHFWRPSSTNESNVRQ